MGSPPKLDVLLKIFEFLKMDFKEVVLGEAEEVQETSLITVSDKDIIEMKNDVNDIKQFMSVLAKAIENSKQ